MLPWLPWLGGISPPPQATCLHDLLLLLLLVPIAAQDKIITCSCTSKDCVAAGARTCNTTMMCYTQILDKPGFQTVTRGCVDATTPLLCENRRPAVNTWPLLHCCKESYCNEEGLPSPPPWHVTGDQAKADKSFYEDDKLTALPPPSVTTEHPSNIITPVYIVVLVVGIFLLMLIGAFAVVVLRRQSRFYGNDFGIDRSTYLKGQCAKTPVPLAKSGDLTSASKNGYYTTNELLSI